MKIYFTREAKKHYNQLQKREQRKVNKKIDYLGQKPFLGKKLKGEFSGVYSLRSWPYRVFYVFKNNKREIWVISISHRQDAYN